MQNRIKHHVPNSIRSRSSSQKRKIPAPQCKSSTKPNVQLPIASDSAFGLHLLRNSDCARHYFDSRFLPQAALFFIYLLFFFMFINKQSPSHKTKRRNKKQGIHNYAYVAQTNNRCSKHNIQEHVSKQYIC